MEVIVAALLFLLIVMALTVMALLGGGVGALVLAKVAGEIVDAVFARRRERRQAFADSLGLARKGGKVYGRYRGYDVTMKEVPGSDDNPPRVEINVELAIPLKGALSFTRTNLLHGVMDMFGAEDLQLGAKALDARYRIFGVEETARTVLLDGPVETLLMDRDFPVPKFQGTSLRSAVSGHFGPKPVMALNHLCELATAMDAASRWHWFVLAQAMGLTLSDDSCRLSGVVDGREVVVLLNRVKGRLRTEVTVRHRRRLAEGTQITRWGEDGIRLGDPVLDGNIVARGEASTLQAALCSDDGRAAVMSVIHAFPDSEVSDELVALRAPGRLGLGLEAAVRDALELARQLEPGLRIAEVESQSGQRRMSVPVSE